MLSAFTCVVTLFNKGGGGVVPENSHRIVEIGAGCVEVESVKAAHHGEHALRLNAIDIVGQTNSKRLKIRRNLHSNTSRA